MSDEVCTGANIFTEGTDPTLKPDDEYPEWLWELSKPLKSVKQIRQEVCCNSELARVLFSSTAVTGHSSSY